MSPPLGGGDHFGSWFVLAIGVVAGPVAVVAAGVPSRSHAPHGATVRIVGRFSLAGGSTVRCERVGRQPRTGTVEPAGRSPAVCVAFRCVTGEGGRSRWSYIGRRRRSAPAFVTPKPRGEEREGVLVLPGPSPGRFIIRSVTYIDSGMFTPRQQILYEFAD